MHRTVLAALLAVAVLPATAGAAPRACADEANDVRLTRGGPLVEARHLDLRSADLATGRRTTTVVVRLTDLTDEDGVWSASWRSGKTPYRVEARRAGGDEAFAAEVAGGDPIPVAGTFDVARNEIRVHLRRATAGRLTSFALTARRAGDDTAPVLVDDFAC